MSMLLGVADFGLEEILGRGDALLDQIQVAEAELAEVLASIPANGGGSSPAALNAAIAAINLLAAAARQSASEAAAFVDEVEAAAGSGGLVIGPDGPQFGTLIQGTNKKVNLPRLYNPNAVFGTGPYNYARLTTDPNTTSTGGGLETLPNDTWWYVYRMVHNNGTPANSGFWCTEIWLPLFSQNKGKTMLRWYMDGAWQPFETIWTSANLDVEAIIARGQIEPGNTMTLLNFSKAYNAFIRPYIPHQSLIGNLSADWSDYWKNTDEEWVSEGGRPGIKVGSSSGAGVWRVSTQRAFGVPASGRTTVSGWYLSIPNALATSDDLKVRVGFYGEFGSGDALFLELARDYNTSGNPLALWAASVKAGVYTRIKMAMTWTLFSIPRYVEIIRYDNGSAAVHIPGIEIVTIPNPPTGLLSHGVRIDKNSSGGFVGANLYSHTVFGN